MKIMKKLVLAMVLVGTQAQAACPFPLSDCGDDLAEWWHDKHDVFRDWYEGKHDVFRDWYEERGDLFMDRLYVLHDRVRVIYEENPLTILGYIWGGKSYAMLGAAIDKAMGTSNTQSDKAYKAAKESGVRGSGDFAALADARFTTAQLEIIGTGKPEIRDQALEMLLRVHDGFIGSLSRVKSYEGAGELWMDFDEKADAIVSYARGRTTIDELMDILS